MVTPGIIKASMHSDLSDKMEIPVPEARRSDAGGSVEECAPGVLRYPGTSDVVSVIAKSASTADLVNFNERLQRSIETHVQDIPDEEKAPYLAGHGIIKGSCGHQIRRCRCSAHSRHIQVDIRCRTCEQASQVKAASHPAPPFLKQSSLTSSLGRLAGIASRGVGKGSRLPVGHSIPPGMASQLDEVMEVNSRIAGSRGYGSLKSVDDVTRRNPNMSYMGSVEQSLPWAKGPKDAVGVLDAFHVGSKGAVTGAGRDMSPLAMRQRWRTGYGSDGKAIYDKSAEEVLMQPMYRSSGTGSGASSKGRWAPFDQYYAPQQSQQYVDQLVKTNPHYANRLPVAPQMPGASGNSPWIGKHLNTVDGNGNIVRESLTHVDDAIPGQFGNQWSKETLPGYLESMQGMLDGYYGLAKHASLVAALRQARNETHTHPTPAQAHAGNYRKGEFSFKGITIKIENPKGTQRLGYDKDGVIAWSRLMHADYGYFKGTEAVDGDAVDVFVGPDLDSDLVVAIDQYKGDTFDETKFIVGCTTQEQGEKLYLRHYPRGWTLGPVSTTTAPQLQVWLKGGGTRKPFKGQRVKAVGRSSSPVARPAFNRIASDSGIR